MNLPKPTAAFFAVFLSLLFVSCQKEVEETVTAPPPSNTNTQLSGTYAFLSLEARTTSTVQMKEDNDEAAAITRSHYISQNNRGTIRFDNGKMSSNGLAYSVETTAKMYSYMNGRLEDSLEAPFRFAFPPTSSTVPYQQVGADSIYCSSGSVFLDGSAAQLPTEPSGFRLKFEGSKLLLLTDFTHTRRENVQGLSMVTRSEAKLVVTLQKQ